MSIRSRLQETAVDSGLVEHPDDVLFDYHVIRGYMVRLRKVEAHWVKIGLTLNAATDRLKQMGPRDLE